MRQEVAALPLLFKERFVLLELSRLVFVLMLDG